MGDCALRGVERGLGVAFPERFLLQRLLQLRKVGLCTSTMLQADLSREKGVTVEASSIRRVLARAPEVAGGLQL